MKRDKTVSCMMLGLLALAMLAGTKAAAVDYTDATITVTPVVAPSLSLSPDTYAFGNMDVNTSTNSAIALTLSNTGNVNVSVDKRIQDQGGWTVSTSTGTDQYVLYCATAAARPALADFLVNESSTSFGAQGNVTGLFDIDGVAPDLAASGGSVDLWFRLDMPSAVTNQDPQIIKARFTATAK